MATRRPASAARQPRSVVLAPDKDLSRRSLLLEMAPEAQVGVPRHQHLLIDGPVNGMAGSAAFANRLVFENKRPGLGRVTLPAGLVLGQQGRAAAFDRRSLVRVMTIATAYLPLEDRMMKREIELSALVQVAIEADLGRFAWINDGMSCTSALIVQAAGPVTRFAADILGILSKRFQPNVSGRDEIARDGHVTLFAALRTGELRPRDLRRGHYR